jgi:hypothetical protein
MCLYGFILKHHNRVSSKYYICANIPTLGYKLLFNTNHKLEQDVHKFSLNKWFSEK